MQTVSYVDLDRFMGDWYVIANIPTFLEKGAHNAVERYDLNDDSLFGSGGRSSAVMAMASIDLFSGGRHRAAAAEAGAGDAR